MRFYIIGLWFMVLCACVSTATHTQQQTSRTDPDVTIKGLRYVMVSVPDIDETLEFYRSAVELELVQRYGLNSSHFATDLLNDAHADIDVAIVRLTNVYLKLIDFDPATKAPVTKWPLVGPGYTHICFKSPATESAFPKFQGAGIDPISRGGEPVDLFGAGTEYFYGRDVNGVMIEIEVDQRPRREDAYWIGHVANVTPDIDRMVDFYEDLLGYSVRRRGALSQNVRADAIADIDGLDMQGAWFALNNIELEFWQFDAPQTPVRSRPARLDEIGYSAIAFEVADLDAEIQRLQQKGVAFIGKPMLENGWKSIFAYDPDGTLFALEENMTTDISQSIEDLAWIDPKTF